MEGKRQRVCSRDEGLAGRGEIWVTCLPRKPPLNLRLLTGKAGVHEPTSQLSVPQLDHPGAFRQHFPRTLYYPVSGSNKAICLGMLLSGVG